MTPEPAFRILTLLLLTTALTISATFRRRADRTGGALDRSQGRSLLIVLRLLGLVVLLPLLGYLVNPAWVAWARLPLPGWLRWSGALIAASMIPALYWLFASIGDNISPTQATREGHQLVTHGPYRWIRHPLYTFGTIFFLAIALATALWWLAMAYLVPLAILLWRTSREEAQLIEAFGEGYQSYMARTGRFLPRLGRQAER